MNNHEMCLQFLVAMRIVARRNGGKNDRDRRFGVTHTTDKKWWLVQDATGKTVFEGEACCAYSARSEALTRVAS